MMDLKKYTVRIALVVAIAAVVQAAPYDGEEFTYIQPDGTAFSIRLHGDEFYAVAETLDGFTIIRDPTTGFWCYADLSADGSELVSSGIAVSTNPPALSAQTKHLRISTSARSTKARSERQKRGIDSKGRPVKSGSKLKTEPAADAPLAAPASKDVPLPAPPSAATTNEKIALTLIVRFPDRDQDVLFSRAQVDNFCNQPGYKEFGNYGSVYDYFLAQSQGRFRYNEVVVPYYTARHVFSYYTDITQAYTVRARELIDEALDDLVAQGFDFSKVDQNGDHVIDGLNVFYAGTCPNSWGEGLWPHSSAHSWSNSGYRASYYQFTDMRNSLTIGTYCHENGHMICDFPDLYDYDLDSLGMYKYSMMSHGNTYSRQRPKNIDAYLKRAAGWCDTRTITSNSSFRAAVRVDGNTVYRYANPTNASEYYLTYLYGNGGWETAPDSGLAFLHVDEMGNNSHEWMEAARHYECSLEQGDFFFDLEWNRSSYPLNGDLYRSDTNNIFSDFSRPDARWWSGSTGVYGSGESGRNGSGNPSGMYIQSISAAERVMTFVVGSNAPSGPPRMDTDESNIVFQVEYNGAPATNEFAVWNQQGGTIYFTNVISYQSGSGWLSCTPATGTVSNNYKLVTVTVNPAGLSAGTTYAGTISVTDTNTSSISFPVRITLIVNPRPDLKLFPTNVSRTAYVDHAVIPDQIELVNTNGGTSFYALSSDAAWLSTEPTNGTCAGETDYFYLNYNTTGLTAGVYTSLVTVADPNALTASRTVSAILTIVDAPGIALYGKGSAVTSGSTIVRTSSGTDFGLISLGFPSTNVFEIRNVGSQPLLLTGTPRITLGGAHSNDFTVTTQPASPVAAGTSSWFNICFNATTLGVRTALVSIANNDNLANPYTFRIVAQAENFSGEIFPRNGQMPAGWYMPTSGSYIVSGWSVSDTARSEGYYSLRTDATANGKWAGIEYTGYFTGGDVSFTCRTSCDVDDRLYFYVDGVFVKGGWSGTNAVWSNCVHALSAGTHSLRWVYQKNGDGWTDGQDCCWIDEVSLPQNVAIKLYPDTNTFYVQEGNWQNIGVYLDQPPVFDATVIVERVSGDTDLTVLSGSNLVFTSENYATWRIVKIAAAEDADWSNGIAVVRCSGEGLTTVEFTSREVDNDTDPSLILPFSEPFEARTAGGINGQYGWVSGTNAVVQGTTVHGGSQALEIQSDTASHTFVNGSNRVAFIWWMKPVAGIAPTSGLSGASAVVWVNTNNSVTVYSNSTEVTLPVQVSSNIWNKFEVEVNYASNVWKLSVNGTNAADNLALYSAQSAFTEFRLTSQTSPTLFDDLNISNIAAQSSALDDWLILHYGTTNVDVSATASNGVNTILQAYIAGLNPTNPSSFLKLTSTRPLIWNSASGRVYTVYWSSNLLNGFQSLETNVSWTGNIFTDTVHGTANEGFYKIEVRLEP